MTEKNNLRSTGTEENNLRSTGTENNDGEKTLVFFGSKNVTMPGLSPEARVFCHGDEIIVTDELREANTDRCGGCWIDLADQPDEQLRRHGKVLFAYGPWPAGRDRIEYGSDAWHDRRDLLRKEAWALADERERAERLALIDSVCGRPVTSTTLRSYRGPNDGPRYE